VSFDGIWEGDGGGAESICREAEEVFEDEEVYGC